MKEHNIDSVELSFTVLKGNAIQFHDAFEGFCTLILNKSNFNQCERRRGILPKRMIWHENGKYFKKFINLHKIFLGVSNNSFVWFWKEFKSKVVTSWNEVFYQTAGCNILVGCKTNLVTLVNEIEEIRSKNIEHCTWQRWTFFVVVKNVYVQASNIKCINLLCTRPDQNAWKFH